MRPEYDDKRGLLILKTEMTITRKFLELPIYSGEKKLDDLRLLTITDAHGSFLYHFVMPAKQDMSGSPDYYAGLDVSKFIGKKLVIDTEMPEEWIAGIIQTDEEITEFQHEETRRRPGLHYTAPYGWLNDPNGLIYKDGIWHMYYQHNPMNTEWANMSWGHATSRDLIHFEYEGDVMYPDMNGSMYSGCAITNDRGCFDLPEGAILFFYTAAGDPTRLSKGIKCTQRMAFSLDGGKTLTKYEGWNLPNIAEGNRDPKIFRHEETTCYVMTLYLSGNRFGIFNSNDLKNWQNTQIMELPPMWECPDLFPVGMGDGEKKWVFTSADGLYYIGSFDGRQFTAETEIQKMYANDIPYAAQTYSNAGERVISVAWLRINHCDGDNYTGAMSVPRELSLGKDDRGFYLRQRFVHEAADFIFEDEDGITVEDAGIKENISADGRQLTVTVKKQGRE